MFTLTSYLRKILTIAVLAVLSLPNITIAQTSTNDICLDGDCSPEIFSIELEEPPLPAIYTNERTDKFKQAYQTFLIIKNNDSQLQGWQPRYNAFELAGKSCLRYYQLESTFGDEYLHNNAFKQFVDQLGRGGSIVQNGFNSSRRGINLENRMSRKCPSEVRATEKETGPRMENLPLEYNRMGIALGYFDEEGNILKQLEEPEKPTTKTAPVRKPSKKERIERMQQQVDELPEDFVIQQRPTKLTDDYQAVQPKIDELRDFSQQPKPELAGLEETQKRLDEVAEQLKDLQDTVLKFPKQDLNDQLEDQRKRNKALEDQAQELAKQEQDLEKHFDDVADRAKALQDEVQDQTAAINDMQNQLAALAKQKAELADLLAGNPRRIIDELTQKVEDAVDQGDVLNNALDEADKDKDRLLQELDELADEKKALEQEVADAKQANDALEKEKDDLVAAAAKTQKEMEAAKAAEEAFDQTAASLNDLPSESALRNKLREPEEALQRAYEPHNEAIRFAKDLDDRLDAIAEAQEKMTDQLRDIRDAQDKIKADGPVNDRTQDRIDDLERRISDLENKKDRLAGDKDRAIQNIDDANRELKGAEDLYDEGEADLDKLRDQIADLDRDRSDLEDKIKQGNGTMEDLNNDTERLLDDYRRFDQKVDRVKPDELKETIEDAVADLESAESKVDELENDLETINTEQEELATDAQNLAEVVVEEVATIKEIVEEQKTLQEVLGEDLKLEIVKPEEWSEGFSVEREYWEAVFHPDDEIVEGYKGRYFEVRIKDSEKNVKLLFGPGEYYMDKTDFRDSYGPVISAFVTEALYGMRQLERELIQLFVQGSADITGQNTFRGNLVNSFPYTEVTFLPYKDDSDDFEPMPIAVEIPANGFTNNDLPNLRGNFLREMISVYSKKLQPLLLEGAVTNEVNTDDRNAIIYLFIPEELVERYERD